MIDKDLLDLVQMNKVGHIKYPKYDSLKRIWIMRLTDDELFSVKRFSTLSIGVKFTSEIERVHNLNTGNKLLPVYQKVSERDYVVVGGFPGGTFTPKWKGVAAPGYSVRVTK